MSDYGYNFGFRRSSDTNRITESRQRTPVGSSLLLGTMVEIDFANPGFLKQSANNAKLVSGVSGLLLQELEWLRTIYQSPANLVDSFMKGVAKPAQLAIITSGDGIKFWVKNTPGATRTDGRVITARTIVSPSIKAGDSVGWDGTQWVPLSPEVNIDGTLTTALTAVPTTSLAVTALTEPIASGANVVLTSGANTFTFVTSAPAALGATTIAVTSATPNFAYPIGTTVAAVISGLTNSVGTCTNVTAQGLVEIVLAG